MNIMKRVCQCCGNEKKVVAIYSIARSSKPKMFTLYEYENEVFEIFLDEQPKDLKVNK